MRHRHLYQIEESVEQAKNLSLKNKESLLLDPGKIYHKKDFIPITLMDSILK
jgi:hypothetical protein